MTKHELLQALGELPREWPLTPCGDSKNPYLPNWQRTPLDKAAIEREIRNGKCQAVGLLLGGDLLAADLDGSSCDAFIERLAGLPVDQALPLTVRVSSGKPGRSQSIYRVPPEWQARIKTRKLATGTPGELFELRYARCQSIVCGVHPETGAYKWLNSPTNSAIAQAPQWLLELMEVSPESEGPPHAKRALQLHNEKPLDAASLARIEDALMAIRPYQAGEGRYPELLKAAAGLLNELGDRGAELLRRWQPDFHYAGGIDGWISSIRRSPNKTATLGSLFWLAKQEGWKDRSVGHYADELQLNGVGDPPPPRESPAGFYYYALLHLTQEVEHICWDSELYRWVGTHYERRSEEAIKGILSSFAAGYAVPRERKEEIEITYPFATANAVRSALEWTKLRHVIDAVNPPGINCTNGYVTWYWEGRDLRVRLDPHDPRRHVITPPVCEFNPQADSSALDCLLECLEPAPREMWLRTIAAALDLPAIKKWHSRPTKALLCLGDGSNGKDTVRTITQRLFGAENLANSSIPDFASYDAGNYFKLASLRAKKISWASETADYGRIDKLQGLKAAITGDPITFERKHRDGIKEAPQTVFLFNMNEPPAINNAQKAIDSRFAIIPFTKTYSSKPRAGELQADPRLKDDDDYICDRILPAFLNRLLEKLQAVAYEGIDYSATQDLLEEMARDACHLRRFMDDSGLEYSPGARIPVLEVWELLLEWYDNEDLVIIETKDVKGKTKQVYRWNDPGVKNDPLVKNPQKLVTRIQTVFPKVSRTIERIAGQGNKTAYIVGLAYAVPSVVKQKVENRGSQGSHGSQLVQDKGLEREPQIKTWFTGDVNVVHSNLHENCELQNVNHDEPRCEPRVNHVEFLPQNLNPSPGIDLMAKREPREPCEPRFSTIYFSDAETEATLVHKANDCNCNNDAADVPTTLDELLGDIDNVDEF